jgi:hypothetical protein
MPSEPRTAALRAVAAAQGWLAPESCVSATPHRAPHCDNLPIEVQRALTVLLKLLAAAAPRDVAMLRVPPNSDRRHVPDQLATNRVSIESRDQRLTAFDHDETRGVSSLIDRKHPSQASTDDSCPIHRSYSTPSGHRLRLSRSSAAFAIMRTSTRSGPSPARRSRQRPSNPWLRLPHAYFERKRSKLAGKAQSWQHLLARDQCRLAELVH